MNRLWLIVLAAVLVGSGGIYVWASQARKPAATTPPKSSTTTTTQPNSSCTGNPNIANFSVVGKTFSWNVINASKVTIEPDIGEVAPSGAHTVTANSSTTYRLTAYCGGKTNTAVVTIGSNSTQTHINNQNSSPAPSSSY